ncbi:MAG: hypothetical protein ACR2PT_16725, partial [Endozoicomonas sp.]
DTPSLQYYFFPTFGIKNEFDEELASGSGSGSGNKKTTYTTPPVFVNEAIYNRRPDLFSESEAGERITQLALAPDHPVTQFAGYKIGLEYVDKHTRSFVTHSFDLIPNRIGLGALLEQSFGKDWLPDFMPVRPTRVTHDSRVQERVLTLLRWNQRRDGYHHTEPDTTVIAGALDLNQYYKRYAIVFSPDGKLMGIRRQEMKTKKRKGN